MSEERRGIKESSDNMLVGLGKVFVGPLTELRNLEIGYHPYGLERVNGWKVELMEELSDGSDVGGAVTVGGSQTCQGLKSATEFEPHK